MRKIRMGMIGGGEGAFIGAVHRMAAALDGQIELVCGAFSSDAAKSKRSGEALFLPANRIYRNFEEMILEEKKLDPSVRMDFVSIVTPNHVHFPPAKMALENGFHVVCDKPLSFNLEEAAELEKLVAETGLLFTLTHNYTGYPMVKQAKAMVKRGDFGKIRKIIVEYPQGWLSTALDSAHSSGKQAAWRTDPTKSGIVGAMGDIGTHAENLAEYITGLKITSLYADLTTFVDGRLLDDDGSVLLEFEGGAKGILFASQICAGEENNLNIRVYGEKGGFQWFQMEPNSLITKWLDKPIQIMRTSGSGILPEASVHTRMPAGHTEGYLEAFGNIYRNFAKQVQARLAGEAVDPIFDTPSVSDGVRGMNFIYKVVESNKKRDWVEM